MSIIKFNCKLLYWKMFVYRGGPTFKNSVAAKRCQDDVKLLSLFFITFFLCYAFFSAWGNYALRSSPLKLRTMYKALQCPTMSNPNQPYACKHNYHPINYSFSSNLVRPSRCPDYFGWIHDDLLPWKETGVTREMVESARKTAHFRVVILDGRVYVEKYRESIQTRDVFTLWGILQLLRRYPGKLPDLELMFDCDDKPVIPQKLFRSSDSKPPPLFKYCSDQRSLDIVFPDSSFWGWPDVNVSPWRNTSKEIQKENKRIPFLQRLHTAYWRGNPNDASWREELLKCNVTKNTDWNARLFTQDWEIDEAREGNKESKHNNQCAHKYNIYIEGRGINSVSEKYILGCDSMTLMVKPTWDDFISRGMMPLVHYWPIRKNRNIICKSIKFAVEWGNNRTDSVQEIGQSASRYINEDMKMEYVYDYMFHLLNEYAKLLRFKPMIPPKAVELCSESLVCNMKGKWKKFMEDSFEYSPSNGLPCTLPLYDLSALTSFYQKKVNSIKLVEFWEDNYWNNAYKKYSKIVY